MRTQPVAILVAGLLVAGCDDSQPTQPNRPIVVRSQAQDQLHRLDPANQAIALRRALYDSGTRCGRVEQAGYVQEYENLSMWMASCDDGRSWAIFVAPDGTAQVRDCATLAELDLPLCRISEEPGPAG